MTVWGLDGETLDAGSYLLTAITGTIAATDVWFRGDGLRAFVLNDNGVVYQLTLSTAWDETTASYAGVSYNTAATTGGQTYGLCFNSDGTKMYVSSAQNDRIYQFALTNPYSLAAGVSYSGKSLDVSPKDTDIRGIWLDASGTRLYANGNTNNKLNQYALSVAEDISTGTWVQQADYDTAFIATPGAVFFKPDGTRYFVVATDLINIYQFEVSTPWDISTRSYAGQSTNGHYPSSETFPYGAYISPDGVYMFMVGQTTDRMYRWLLGVPTASSAGWTVGSKVMRG